MMSDYSSILINLTQSLPGLFFALALHEWAHAAMANHFGDETAKNAGRMTMNPFAHVDPWGTVVMPMLGILTQSMVIGWAKPVPINMRNVPQKSYKKALFWISFAGPLANLLLGIFCSALFALLLTLPDGSFSLQTEIRDMLRYSVYINSIFFLFNLIPIPPLDGSNMISAFLDYNALRKYQALASYTPWIIMGVMLLSFMDVPILNLVFIPAIRLGELMTGFFYLLFQGIL